MARPVQPIYPAAAGEETACRHALDGAAQEISYGAASEDLPYLALNETHLARWRGNCLVLFGDPQTADDLAAALARSCRNST